MTDSKSIHLTKIIQFCFFLWLSNIPLYICATSSLSIHLLMDTYVTIILKVSDKHLRQNQNTYIKEKNWSLTLYWLCLVDFGCQGVNHEIKGKPEHSDMESQDWLFKHEHVWATFCKIFLELRGPGYIIRTQYDGDNDIIFNLILIATLLGNIYYYVHLHVQKQSTENCETYPRSHSQEEVGKELNIGFVCF